MADSVPLNQDNLGRLSCAVRVPAYDRRRASAGIAHIGVGGFHRAHQAVYADQLLQDGENDEWGYCGIGLLPQDASMHEALSPQDWLYTVLERGASGNEARVVGSLLNYLYAPGNMEAVLTKLASPETRIVSLTITEGGYYINEASGEFNDAHPDIVRDLQNPEDPRCSFGVLLEALDRRRRKGIAPFTVMSCDNLQHNGSLTRKMLVAFAERRDPLLSKWVKDHGAFPNSMVDRITPATTDEDRTLLRKEFGIQDNWPVVAEPFMQWVIEDEFPGGRPKWEAAGAQMTTDVLPYEKIKLRLLNAGHQAICYIGMLLGYRYSHEAMQDARIHALLIKMMDTEVTPLLKAPEGIDLAAYKKSLIDRFSNPAIGDQLPRIGTEGSARIPKFVLPSIAEGIGVGLPVRLLSFTVAAWFRYLGGTDDIGRKISIADPMAEELQQKARLGGSDAGELLGIQSLFGDVLPRCPAFSGEVKSALASFYERGANATLTRYVSE